MVVNLTKVSPHGSTHISGDIVPSATTSKPGLMSSTDKTKLDGIAAGAEVNVQPDWNETDTNADGYIKNKPSVSGGSRGVYGATVYKAGSTYYAIDITGTIITSGSVFSTVLQAAIDALDPSATDAGGEVRICAGAYTQTAGITVQRNVKLVFDKFAVITISGDIDAYTMLQNSLITGGRFVVGSGYTGNVIVVNADDQFWSDRTSGITNIEMYNPGNTGTAIYIRTIATSIIANESGGFIYGFIIDNVRIWKFDYGIRFYQHTYDGMNWINGNKFKDIWITWPNWGIHASADDETGASGVSDFMENTFENVNIQSRNGTGAHTHPVWRILGSNNVFRNCSVWDWANADYQYAIECSAMSSNNFFEWLESKDILPYVTDAGYNNVFCNITDIRDKPGVMLPLNHVKSHFFNPVLEEITLHPGASPNQLRFTAPNTQEQSTDGTTWTTSTRLTATQLKALMIGGGEGLAEDAAAIWPAPTVGGKAYYRLTWNATSVYTILNHLHLRMNTGNNTVTVKIEAYKTSTTTWLTVASGTVKLDGYGFVDLPHSNITFMSGSDSSYRGNVRLTFSISSASYAVAGYITSAEWFGPYPHGKSTVESYDENKSATFPKDIHAIGMFADTISGLIYPVQASTTDAAGAYEIGAMYFDTTMGVPRFGGASAWESIGATKQNAARAFRLKNSGGTAKAIDSYTNTNQIDTQVSAADGDYFEFWVWSDAGAETIIDITVRKASSYGKFQLYLNGSADLATLYDMYASTASNTIQSITTTRDIIPGWNLVQILVNGKNASSSGYGLGLGPIRIR